MATSVSAKLRRGRVGLLSAAALAFVLPSAAWSIQITGSDAVSAFTVATGVYTTADGTGDATGEQPAAVLQTDLHVELQLDAAGEASFTVNTRFEGTPDASPDIFIWDGSDLLLTADIVFADVSAISTTLDAITIGSTDGTFTKSHITLTGGTLANDFGGVGTPGEIQLFLTDTSLGDITFATFGNAFQADMTAQTNITIEFYPVPEASVNAMLLLGTIGLMSVRRYWL
jgi:hypothetical protein